jgi:hypothetical protein
MVKDLVVHLDIRFSSKIMVEMLHSTIGVSFDISRQSCAIDEPSGLVNTFDLENGNIVWTTYLNQGPTKSETYDCQPCHESQSGETTCAKCWRYETALSVHPCDNVKPRGLCDLKASCDTRLPIDPPYPFPFTPKKVMVVGDSISHGADADWTWRYHAWQWRMLPSGCLQGTKY